MLSDQLRTFRESVILFVETKLERLSNLVLLSLLILLTRDSAVNTTSPDFKESRDWEKAQLALIAKMHAARRTRRRIY